MSKHINKTQNDLTATVQIYEKVRDCFFKLDSNLSWCPGWAIAEIILPLTAYSNRYILTCDSIGETSWISASKVKYRGEIASFDYHYFQSVFDWEKYKSFTAISYIYSFPAMGDPR